MLGVITSVAVLAVAIPLILATARALACRLAARPMRGLALVVPVYLFLAAFRHSGLLENLGLNSERILAGVLACGILLVILEAFHDRSSQMS